MSISEKAIVICPVIQSTTLKHTDKEAGYDLALQKRANSRATKVVVDLVNPVHLKAITAVMSAYRTYIQANSVPWFAGAFLIPKGRYFEIARKVSDFKNDLEVEVDSFITKYSGFIYDAKNELGDLFAEDAYPEPEELRHRFQIGATFVPVADTNQFSNLGFDDDTVDRLQQEALEAENQLLRDATIELFDRVKNRVAMLANRLRDPETKRYRESLVTGLETLLDILPGLNVTGNKDLTDILDDVRRMLAGFDLEEAKKSDDLKAETVVKCDEILDKLSGFMV